eukprot:57280_1
MATRLLDLPQRSARKWSYEQETVQRLLDSIHNHIDKMIASERNGERDQYVQHKRDAKLKLKKVIHKYPELQKTLEQGPTGLTDEEYERRTLQLHRIRSEYKRLRDQIQNKRTNGLAKRDIHNMETYGTMELTNTQIKQQQYEKKQNMDDELSDLYQGIKKINMITYDINNELIRQDAVIDEIGDNMDDGLGKIHANTKRVDFLNTKSKDKGMCCLMTILFIVIVLLVIWNFL